MVENLAKGFSELKASRARQEWPTLQVNGTPVSSYPPPPPPRQVQSAHTSSRSRVEAAAGHPVNRSRSPSAKRTAEEVDLHSTQPQEPA